MTRHRLTSGSAEIQDSLGEALGVGDVRHVELSVQHVGEDDDQFWREFDADKGSRSIPSKFPGCMLHMSPVVLHTMVSNCTSLSSTLGFDKREFPKHELWISESRSFRTPLFLGYRLCCSTV